MNPADPEYAAFLDRLPELRRLYDPRLHQFEVTNGPGRGDSLANVERYFARVGSVREPNRQTLRRLVAFVEHVCGGTSRKDAVEQAWRHFPDPRHGIPRYFGAPPAVRQQHARLQDEHRTRQCVRGAADIEGRLPSLEDCVERIEDAYDRFGHSLGWRFLMGPRRTFCSDTRVALITSNPGGRIDYPECPRASVERGNAYWVERWPGSVQAGDAPLQRQVQQLFEMVAEIIGEDSAQNYVESKVLTAYFVPFRSRRFGELFSKKESIDFGRSLWSGILAGWRPGKILTIDADTFKNLRDVLSSRGAVQDHREFPTGWGRVRAEAMRYLWSACGRTVTLARLPHLSTFKLFSRRACQHPMDTFLRYVFGPVA